MVHRARQMGLSRFWRARTSDTRTPASKDAGVSVYGPTDLFDALEFVERAQGNRVNWAQFADELLKVGLVQSDHVFIAYYETVDSRFHIECVGRRGSIGHD